MIARIGRRRTFSELRQHGRRVRHGSVRINHLPLETAAPQVAFAIGRSFGNAVQRNRGRRRLRAALVSVMSGIGADSARFDLLNGAFLMSGNRGLITSSFSQLEADVERCFDALADSVRPAVRP